MICRWRWSLWGNNPLCKMWLLKTKNRGKESRPGQGVGNFSYMCFLFLGKKCNVIVILFVMSWVPQNKYGIQLSVATRILYKKPLQKFSSLKPQPFIMSHRPTSWLGGSTDLSWACSWVCDQRLVSWRLALLGWPQMKQFSSAPHGHSSSSELAWTWTCNTGRILRESGST